MRTLLLMPVVLSLMLAGCTSVKTLELPSSELQSQIRAGQLLAVGDRVTVVTANGVRHKIQLTGIDERELHGTGSRQQGETIAIDEIVAVQTRDISAGKTALLAGGVVGVTVIVALIVGGVLLDGVRGYF